MRFQELFRKNFYHTLTKQQICWHFKQLKLQNDFVFVHRSESGDNSISKSIENISHMIRSLRNIEIPIMASQYFMHSHFQV